MAEIKLNIQDMRLGSKNKKYQMGDLKQLNDLLSNLLLQLKERINKNIIGGHTNVDGSE